VAAERQARALSVILAGTTLALIAGVPAGAFIGAALGWRATLGVIAVVCVPALLAVLFATPTRPGESSSGAHDRTLLRALRTLRTGPVQLAVALAILVNAATFCSFTYLAVIASGPADLTETQIPLLLALFGIGAFGGVMLAGKYADAHWRQVISVSGPVL